jgi:hypothetical protein
MNEVDEDAAALVADAAPDSTQAGKPRNPEFSRGKNSKVTSNISSAQARLGVRRIEIREPG